MLSRMSTESFQREGQRLFFRLAFGGLSFAVLTLALGCKKSPYTVGEAEVSGKVFFDGKPLPGGQVSFVAVNGALAARGDIGEDGQYQIKAPIGEVQIGVNNRMLAPIQPGKGPPKGRMHPTAEGFVSDDEKRKALKGRWVDLPSKYADPATSGLKYTVTPGNQTHDIQLSKSAPVSPNAP